MSRSASTRKWLRATANGWLESIGLRVVNARWGPRGPMNTLRRIRAQGITPRQIVDVGASNGAWTQECLRVFPEARYFLVEPLPANQAALARLSSTHANVQTWQGALGSASGTLALHVHGDQSSFLSSDSFPSDVLEEVEIRRLDSFLGTERLQEPDFIKADVQGFEVEVLEGAQACLKTTQLLLLEVSYRELYQGLPLAHEVIAAVGRLGFRIYDICTYLGRPSDGELVQSDILFAARGSPLFRQEGYF